MKILLVDDSESFRKSMVQLIESSCKSPTFKEAATVAEGIRLSKDLDADAVLLDMRFPDGLGLDVLRVIRKDPHPVLVIVLTNYSSDQFRAKALLDGADYFLDKATEFEKAVAILKEKEEVL